ncbi:MAG TPA: secretin N-terminal domain-containing protein [Longimicrobium sp.]
MRILVAAAATALLAAPHLYAQQQPAGVVRTPGGVQVDFQNTDMRLVVAALADAAGLNVVYGDLPQKAVTLRTSTPVPLAQVRVYLSSLLQANDLELKDEGSGLLRIVPRAGSAQAVAQPQAQQAYAGPQDGSVRVFVYRLRHAPAEDMARSIGALFGIGDGGVAAHPDRAQSLTEQLRGQSLDANGDPRVPRPQAGLNAGLQGQVQVFADSRTNALLIRATPADYETLRQAIEQLDTRPLQVMIEVLIAEVRRNSQFGLGIDVRVPQHEINDNGTSIGGELVGGTAGDVALRILKLGNVEANVIIHALAASGDVTILSRPVILAQNNEAARILVGDQRPFIQISRSFPTDNAARDQVIQYRDVGTQLTIRPTVNPDGYVTLSVLQEVSNATNETQFGAPIISTREAETRLLVKDGHTVVIGGLIDHQRDSNNSGVPLLKDIPLIGGLFRSTSRQKTSTELFLFLIPHVLYSDEDVDGATRRVRERTERLDRALPDSIPLFWKESQDTTAAPVGTPTGRRTRPIVAPAPAAPPPAQPQPVAPSPAPEQPAQPQPPAPQGGGTAPESDAEDVMASERRGR